MKVAYGFRGGFGRFNRIIAGFVVSVFRAFLCLFESSVPYVAQ
jgi:hypothetical protein